MNNNRNIIPKLNFVFASNNSVDIEMSVIQKETPAGHEISLEMVLCTVCVFLYNKKKKQKLTLF